MGWIRKDRSPKSPGFIASVLGSPVGVWNGHYVMDTNCAGHCEATVLPGEVSVACQHRQGSAAKGPHIDRGGCGVYKIGVVHERLDPHTLIWKTYLKPQIAGGFTEQLMCFIGVRFLKSAINLFHFLTFLSFILNKVTFTFTCVYVCTFVHIPWRACVKQGQLKGVGSLFPLSGFYALSHLAGPVIFK